MKMGSCEDEREREEAKVGGKVLGSDQVKVEVLNSVPECHQKA